MFLYCRFLKKYRGTAIYIRYIAVYALYSTILCACTGSIDHSAFTSQKTYAVVTFGLTASVQFIEESMESVAFTQAGTDKMLSTRPVANSMAREYIGGFMQYAPVKIIHGKHVTTTKQYRNFISVNTHSDQRRYVAAGKYHNFWHEGFSQSKELAKALSVDGVILIYCDLEVSGRAKLSSDGNMKGAYRPGIISRIVAYDKYGKRVINSSIKYKSARRVVPNISGVHYLELRRTLAGYDARLAGIAAAKEMWGEVTAGR